MKTYVWLLSLSGEKLFFFKNKPSPKDILKWKKDKNEGAMPKPQKLGNSIWGEKLYLVIELSLLKVLFGS